MSERVVRLATHSGPLQASPMGSAFLTICWRNGDDEDIRRIMKADKRARALGPQWHVGKRAHSRWAKRLGVVCGREGFILIQGLGTAAGYKWQLPFMLSRLTS